MTTLTALKRTRVKSPLGLLRCSNPLLDCGDQRSKRCVFRPLCQRMCRVSERLVEVRRLDALVRAPH
jgi:hypothetical protein